MNSFYRTSHALLFRIAFTFLLLITLGGGSQAFAQTHTSEDSLNAGIAATHPTTIIGGYGEASYTRDMRWDTSQVDLRRVVVFFGHEFNADISFFSELEVEDAKVEGDGGSLAGEVAFEQAYVRFNVNQSAYLTAGLFLPRMGIINENHLPTTFNGVDRPFVETLVLPSTWREIGVGLWGSVDQMPGLNYSLAVVNGLNSAGFTHGEGIIGGRMEGRDAPASNLAINGSLQYYTGDLRLQVCGYYGGSAGLDAQQSDSLKLNNGLFGTPVAIGEADIMYHNSGWSLRALGATVSIPDAEAINAAYANNTPSQMIGAYAELAYNLFHACSAPSQKELTFFARYEYLDLNYKIPGNGVADGLMLQRYVVAGITYKPLTDIAIKFDYKLRTTGQPNPQLQMNPLGQTLPYYTSNGYFDLGIGYSF